jgi:predicted DNA-binding transcriptional regulator AlpA
MSNPGSRRIELAAHARALAAGIQAGQAIPAGRLFGLPELPGDDYWLDMAGATALTGIPPKTITGWLARGGPARNPFPVPDRLLYRVYWRRTEIESWQARETVADSEPCTRLNGE